MRKWFLVVFCSLWSSSIFARKLTFDLTLPPNNHRHSYWTFGLGYEVFSLNFQEEFSIDGHAPVMNLGYIHVGEQWLTFSDLHYLSGYSRVIEQNDQELDVTGYGSQFILSPYFFDFSPKVPQLKFGLALGGRFKVLKFKKIVSLSNFRENFIKSYETTRSILSLQSGFLFYYLKQERSLSNREENLTTRIEGALGFFGVSLPVYQYPSKKNQLTLSGYHLFLSASIILGT